MKLGVQVQFLPRAKLPTTVDFDLQYILNKHVKTRDVLGAQEALIEAGYEEQAQL